MPLYFYENFEKVRSLGHYFISKRISRNPGIGQPVGLRERLVVLVSEDDGDDGRGARHVGLGAERAVVAFGVVRFMRFMQLLKPNARAPSRVRLCCTTSPSPIRRRRRLS